MRLTVVPEMMTSGKLREGDERPMYGKIFAKKQTLEQGRA